MTSRRVSVCTGLTRRSLVVPLGDQLQHILHTVHLINDGGDEDDNRVGDNEDHTGKEVEDEVDPKSQ